MHIGLTATFSALIAASRLLAQPTSGTVLWTFGGDGQLSSPPLVVGGAVFVASSVGNLYSVKASNGSQISGLSVGGSADAGMAEGDGILTVPFGNALVAFG